MKWGLSANRTANGNIRCCNKDDIIAICNWMQQQIINVTRFIQRKWKWMNGVVMEYILCISMPSWMNETWVFLQIKYFILHQLQKYKNGYNSKEIGMQAKMKPNAGRHEAYNASIVTIIKQPIQITSMLGRHMFPCLRASIARVLYGLSITRNFVYVLLFLFASLTGYLHATTPEFKRGGVYLSGDVILGKIQRKLEEDHFVFF